MGGNAPSISDIGSGLKKMGDKAYDNLPPNPVKEFKKNFKNDAASKNGGHADTSDQPKVMTREDIQCLYLSFFSGGGTLSEEEKAQGWVPQYGTDKDGLRSYKAADNWMNHCAAKFKALGLVGQEILNKDNYNIANKFDPEGDTILASIERQMAGLPKLSAMAFHFNGHASSVSAKVKAGQLMVKDPKKPIRIEHILNQIHKSLVEQGLTLDILTITLDACCAAGGWYRLRDELHRKGKANYPQIKWIDFYVPCEWDEVSIGNKEVGGLFTADMIKHWEQDKPFELFCGGHGAEDKEFKEFKMGETAVRLFVAKKDKPYRAQPAGIPQFIVVDDFPDSDDEDYGDMY